jgi:WD40 repeat protein
VWLATLPDLRRLANITRGPSSIQSLQWHEQRGLTVAGGEPGESGYIGILQLNNVQELPRKEYALTSLALSANDLFTSAVWSADGSQLAAVALDGTGLVRSVGPDAAHRVEASVIEPVTTAADLLEECSLQGHSAGLTGAVWIQPHELATCSLDTTIRTWRTATPFTTEPLSNRRTLNQHTHAILGMSCNFLNPQQPLLATFSEDQTVRLWHPLTGRMLRFVRIADDRVSACAWSSTGDQLWIGTRGGWLQQIDVATATILHRQHVAEDWITAIICLPDRSVLYGTGEGQVAHLPWRDN